MISIAAQTLVASLAAVSLFVAFRWLHARAALAARLYAAGLLLRVVAGLILAISWQVPPHGGRFDADARWFPDAQTYFSMAREAAAGGLALVDNTGPSPTFVRTLALWMAAAGDSHAAIMLLSLLIYVGICVAGVAAIVRGSDPSTQQTAALVVGAFALSPNLILLSTQPLKDTLFFGALTLVILGSRRILADVTRKVVALSGPALAATWVGIYLMAGMRVYYVLLILGVLGLLIGVRLLQESLAKRRWLIREGVSGALFLLTIWLGCWVGGGPYYTSLVDPVTAGPKAMLRGLSASWGWGGSSSPGSEPKPHAGLSAGVVALVERSRAGFEASGGGTNMAPPELDRSARVGLASRLQGFGLGLAAVFVPVTVLRTSGLISFSGGGRALALTDIDTLFLDVSMAACLLVTWRQRALLRGQWTGAVFALMLGVTSALLVGYVVTNYGTLFRLRLMAAVPIWLLPLFVARNSPSHLASADRG